MGRAGPFFVHAAYGALLEERLGFIGSGRGLATWTGDPAIRRPRLGNLAAGASCAAHPVRTRAWVRQGSREFALDAHEHHDSEQNGQPAAHRLLLLDKRREMPGQCNRK